MDESRKPDNDPERTLITLEQLSQTIEMMINVVNRLRRHLNEQLQARHSTLHEPAGSEREISAAVDPWPATPGKDKPTRRREQQTRGTKPDRPKPDSVVIEIRGSRSQSWRKKDRTVH